MVDLVWPRNCVLCSTPLGETDRGVVCPDCLRTVRWIEPPHCQRCSLPFEGVISESFACGHCQGRPFHFERAVCACRAEGVVRESIHRFKYRGQMYLGTHLADWLVAAARSRIDRREIDAIVPVPLHPRKKRQRGFNQAEYLADALGRALAAPVIASNLKRVRDTRTQTQLDARQRASNLRHAFAVRRPSDLEGRRLVLVDDVFTTGATLDGCAKVLIAAGARQVVALTVARGI